MSKKANIKMTKIVLAISFIILFGRLVYSAVGAGAHHQTQKQTQVDQSTTPAP